LADSYFSARSPGEGSELRELFNWVSSHFSRLIVVLPPSERLFQREAEAYGSQHRYWRLITDLARETDAQVIDCSTSCVSQPGFADPVHLNANGVAEYSAEIGKRLLPHRH
jgi:hypothetical protein